MSNLKVGQVTADKWLNSDGTENYKCRAWVNFNGSGTVAIRDSGNVSSVVDMGTGYYKVNFIKAMPHENYSVVGMVGNLARQDFIKIADNQLPEVGAVPIFTINSNGVVDVAYVMLQVVC